MYSMQTKLNKLRTALLTITALRGKIFHDYAGSRATLPYLIWYEESEDDSFEADSKKQEIAVAGYIEYYTATEFDPIVDTINETLNNIKGLTWTLVSRTSGDPVDAENSDIHYTWQWRLI